MTNRRFYFKEGELLLVDKPLDWTSFDVVNKIRYAAKRHCKHLDPNFGKHLKVGHAGTLDPKATGLLLICTGKKTKGIKELTGLSKEYTGTIFLGATRPSYDIETEIDQTYGTAHITEELILETANQFEGASEQMPPIFSAIKIDGKPVYKKARRGEEVKLKKRTIQIEKFEINGVLMPEVSFTIACSKGTYIRSIAHDFGKAMNSGAYLASLTRTRIGQFYLKNAWKLDQLIEAIDSDYQDGAQKEK